MEAGRRVEILVLPFFGQGHLFPCMELCKRLSTYHNCKSILILPSNLSSSVPSSIRRHPFLEVIDVPNQPQKLVEEIESFLAERYNKDTGVTRPICAVIDVMMNWSLDIFKKFGLPIASFFTFGSCASAIDYAAWVAKVDELKPGQTRILDGLPSNMATISYLDHKLRCSYKPPSHMRNLFPPPTSNRPEGGRRLGPGDAPGWLEEVQGSIALLFNTCDDIDGPFMSYLSDKINKPVYGIGPLLSEHYWKSFDSINHDTQFRSNRLSNYTDDQVVEWLDKKPFQSVIYVSFGSELGPSMEGYNELANALQETNWSFIWVVQPNSTITSPPPAGFSLDEPNPQPKEDGYYPIGLDKKVGERGLIIKGWAPQVIILSHRSVGGFLSHCGWNSTMESMGKGVPILAWPIRGDQFHNANLIVRYFKSGHHLLHNGNNDGDKFDEIMVKKNDIMKGINLLMDDKEAHIQAMASRSKFKNGFPTSSMASLKSFLDAQTL